MKFQYLLALAIALGGLTTTAYAREDCPPIHQLPDGLDECIDDLAPPPPPPPPPPTGIDLTPSVYLSTPTSGGVTTSVSVHNVGSETAPAGYSILVEWFMRTGTATIPLTPFATTTLDGPALAGGDTYAVPVASPFDALSGFRVGLCVTVDKDNELGESNENNNRVCSFKLASPLMPFHPTP